MLSMIWALWTLQPLTGGCCLNPAALLKLRGSANKVLPELEEMKGEAAHTQAGLTIHEFFKRGRYKQPIVIVLVINLGSQLSGFNAVSLTSLASGVDG